MISLVKFAKYLSQGAGKTGSPITISAKDLDGNFEALTPVPDKLGIFTPMFEKSGYYFQLKAGGKDVAFREINICVDGTAKKMMVLGTDPY
jgi:hypothetical protein